MLHNAGALTYDPYAQFSGYTDEGDIIWYGGGGARNFRHLGVRPAAQWETHPTSDDADGVGW